MSKFKNVDFITLLLITIWGITQGQVTVFYIIYLYWFQEFIRTLVDFNYIFWNQPTLKEKINCITLSYGSFFILFIYFVFIVLLFGFMLNFNNHTLLYNNMSVLVFQNTFFNLNIILFLTEYIYYRQQSDTKKISLTMFNKRHIILHISIILGAILQLVIVPKFDMEKSWASALIILPFLLLKLLIDKPISSTN